jgi:predicted alpha/beta superfamily hydrolase
MNLSADHGSQGELQHIMKPVLLSLFCFVVGPTLASASEVKWSALQGLNEVRYHEVGRSGDFQPLHIFVRLPADYDPAAGTTYPTVYLLDGGVMFPILAGYQRQLELSEDVPPMIVVGLSYGTDDWRQGNLRSTDYTAAAPDRDYWGGAPAFLQFLQTQVLPLIENNYASDPQRRILFGQSLGGQFVLHTAMSAPETFFGLIANNPALHRNLRTFLEAPSSSTPADKPRLFVSSAELDAPRFREPAQRWIKHWTAQDNLPWELQTSSLPGYQHANAAPPAYRNGLRWIFSTKAPAKP